MASVGTDKRNGNIVIRTYAGINPTTGKEHTISKTLPNTATDEEIEAAVAELESRASVTKKNRHAMTIGSVVKYYLEGCELSEMSPTTISAYESYTRRHVIPRIGSIMFDKADPSTFSRFYRDLRQPKEIGGGGLAASTVEKIHAFLSGCFSRLRADGMIPKNPLIGVKVARAKNAEVRPLMPKDFSKLVGYLQDVIASPITDDESFERYMFAVMFWDDLNSGVRRGELAGFQEKHWIYRGGHWSLRVARVLVQVKKRDGDAIRAKEPKSQKSRRMVTVDETTADVTNAYLEIKREILAEHGVEVGEETPLFCHSDGSFIKPAEITDAFKRLVRDLKLDKRAHLHTLRHTHASYLIDAGANLKDIQDRFGHASSSTTADIYGHLLPGRDAEVAASSQEIVRKMGASAKKMASTLYVPTCPKDGRPCERYTEGSKNEEQLQNKDPRLEDRRGDR